MKRTSHPPPGFAPGFVAGVLDDALTHDARTYAISGLQGTGKSTLATQVAALARTRGLRAAVLSIDDFYLGRRERQHLARDVHPLLATRGPPGTHEVALACETLDALHDGRPARWPRFDKLADTRLPPSRWRRMQAADLILFEGWFLKTPAQSDPQLRTPINALERDEDGDGTWRRWCNDALARDYPPLWSRLERLLFLQPPGFEIVPEWRWQQEQAMQAARAGRRGMDRAEVERFVQLFERVSRRALATLPGIAERTVRLDAGRTPIPMVPGPAQSPAMGGSRSGQSGATRR
ncbi:kinase [Marilutibacter alkalisoli]|uniref:kinase n=1 Tax=Marilutibacter alkalisoli TaxID=2591633 RepID=UPI001FC951F7|nr:kinase [Lysobacter alkalisoli]